MDMKKMAGLTTIGGLAGKLAQKADVVDLVEGRLQKRAVAQATRRAVLTAAVTSMVVSAAVVTAVLRGGGWWRSMWSGVRQSSPAPPVAASKVDPQASAAAQPTIVE